MEKRQFVILFLLQTLFLKGKRNHVIFTVVNEVNLLDQCFSNFWYPKQILKLLSQSWTWNNLEYDHNFHHLFIKYYQQINHGQQYKQFWPNVIM